MEHLAPITVGIIFYILIAWIACKGIHELLSDERQGLHDYNGEVAKHDERL